MNFFARSCTSSYKRQFGPRCEPSRASCYSTTEADNPQGRYPTGRSQSLTACQLLQRSTRPSCCCYATCEQSVPII